MTVDFAVHSRCLAGLGGQGPYPGNISDSFPVRKPAMSAFESTSNGTWMTPKVAVMMLMHPIPPAGPKQLFERS